MTEDDKERLRVELLDAEAEWRDVRDERAKNEAERKRLEKIAEEQNRREWGQLAKKLFGSSESSSQSDNYNISSGGASLSDSVFTAITVVMLLCGIFIREFLIAAGIMAVIYMFGRYLLLRLAAAKLKSINIDTLGMTYDEYIGSIVGKKLRNSLHSEFEIQTDIISGLDKNRYLDFFYFYELENASLDIETNYWNCTISICIKDKVRKSNGEHFVSIYNKLTFGPLYSKRLVECYTILSTIMKLRSEEIH